MAIFNINDIFEEEQSVLVLIVLTNHIITKSAWPMGFVVFNKTQHRDLCRPNCGFNSVKHSTEFIAEKHGALNAKPRPTTDRGVAGHRASQRLPEWECIEFPKEYLIYIHISEGRSAGVLAHMS